MKLIKAIIIRDKIIPLNNKNLIIIGNNGSGKTYILDNIYSEIKKIVAGTDYIKKNTYYKREKILDELGIAFNNFSAVLDLDENEKNRFKDLLNNIEIYKLTKITKHAKRHFWLNDVCTCHGLLPSHSA